MSLWYSNGGLLPDNVKLAEAFGGRGERVCEPAQLARAMASEVPYLIDVIVERECDCSMGAGIDCVREFA